MKTLLNIILFSAFAASTANAQSILSDEKITQLIIKKYERNMRFQNCFVLPPSMVPTPKVTYVIALQCALEVEGDRQ